MIIYFPFIICYYHTTSLLLFTKYMVWAITFKKKHKVTKMHFLFFLGSILASKFSIPVIILIVKLNLHLYISDFLDEVLIYFSTLI